MEPEYLPILPGRDDEGKRIDAVLRRHFADLPLSRIYRALRSGEVRIAGKKVPPSYRVTSGVPIEIRPSLAARSGAHSPPTGSTATFNTGSAAGTAAVKAMIVWETEHLLALNKPRGVPVQGGRDLEAVALDALVRGYLASRTTASLSFRPGPLHRLDRNTTGLLFFSVSLEGAHRFLAHLQSGACRKYYLALLAGKLTAPETWQDSLVRDPISRISHVSSDSADGGKSAETHVQPLLSDGSRVTLALCRIVTGRTHQIRAQAASHGFPLAGDRKYGDSSLPEYLLHSLRLELPEYDPVLRFRSISAPVADGQREMLHALFPAKEVDEAISDQTIDRMIQ